ncbi:MAG: hypothetical protein ACP5FT_00445 [Acidilobus sp.]
MRVDRARSRAIKESLMSQAKGKIDLDEFVEWLWDDFGIRVRRTWEDIYRAVVNSDEVLPQDLAAFMISQGMEPDEGAWDVIPIPGSLRGRQGPKEGGGN